MKNVTLMAMFLSALVAGAPFSVAQAGDSVFRGKQHSQHDLRGWEQKKMLADFNKRFASTESGAFQKLNNNPWAAKKARQEARSAKMLGMTANWGSCREYAYKQRGQCYAKGGDAYTCERYYDARVEHCDQTY